MLYNEIKYNHQTRNCVHFHAQNLTLITFYYLITLSKLITGGLTVMYFLYCSFIFITVSVVLSKKTSNSSTDYILKKKFCKKFCDRLMKKNVFCLLLFWEN